MDFGVQTAIQIQTLWNLRNQTGGCGGDGEFDRDRQSVSGSAVQGQGLSLHFAARSFCLACAKAGLAPVLHKILGSVPSPSPAFFEEADASTLWFLIQMSMLEIAGGVRVVHSHPLCAGATAGAGSPVVANGGGVFYEGKPPIFPKARKRAYMRALDRARPKEAHGTVVFSSLYNSYKGTTGLERKPAP